MKITEYAKISGIGKSINAKEEEQLMYTSYIHTKTIESNYPKVNSKDIGKLEKSKPRDKRRKEERYTRATAMTKRT